VDLHLHRVHILVFLAMLAVYRLSLAFEEDSQPRSNMIILTFDDKAELQCCITRNPGRGCFPEEDVLATTFIRTYSVLKSRQSGVRNDYCSH